MYAYNLPKRIGYDAFEDLHVRCNDVLRLSIPEIKELIITYKNKIK
jgi:hypothetical protein